MKVKNSYIPWSFLDIVAQEEKLFQKRDLQVDFFAVGRSGSEPADKVAWYGDLMKGGEIDAYSVCAWGAIDRLAEKQREKIVAATTSSGYAFSILVAPGLGIKTAAEAGFRRTYPKPTSMKHISGTTCGTTKASATIRGKRRVPIRLRFSGTWAENGSRTT